MLYCLSYRMLTILSLNSTLNVWVLSQEDEPPSDGGRCGVSSSQEKVSYWHNHVILMKFGVLVRFLLLQEQKNKK